MPDHQGYAVASCHVERPLDEDVWRRYRTLLERRPGGFQVASLMRPPMEGEDESLFVDRAHEATRLGPFGHHIHWTSPTHARPTGADPAGAVRREGAWLREHGLDARFFCGGGWYTDAAVMSVVAEFGYADCTATAWRPSYLPEGSPRASLDAPAWVLLDDGRRVLELPTTHSLGAAARSLVSRLPQIVHLHFHDYELLDAKRRSAIYATLTLLARRRRPVALGSIEVAREVGWVDIWAG